MITTVNFIYLMLEKTKGSRQDQEPLTFSTVPGRRVPLPETTTVSDYFNIFIKDDDFEEIAGLCSNIH
jgi:hypothetical protein